MEKKEKRSIENGDISVPNQTPNQCNLTLDVKDGSTAFAPVMVGNDIAGGVSLSLQVGTKDRKEQGYNKEEREAKAPQADSTDDAGRGHSQDQRDEDMDMSD